MERPTPLLAPVSTMFLLLKNPISSFPPLCFKAEYRMLLVNGNSWRISKRRQLEDPTAKGWKPSGYAFYRRTLVVVIGYSLKRLLLKGGCPLCDRGPSTLNSSM